MQPFVAALWGAAFGTSGLLLAGAVAAWLASLRRMALLAITGTVLYATFAASYLGLLPGIDAATRLRCEGTVFMVCGVLLGHLVLAMIGHLRVPAVARRWRTMIYGYGVVIVGASGLLPPMAGFALCTAGGFIIGAVALALSLRRAQRGDRLAGVNIVGVVSICISSAALTHIALDPDSPWWVHAVGAIAGVVYQCVIALVLWLRFSYLIELRRVIAHGPAYDPVTRMRTHSETTQMVGLAFFDNANEGSLVGVIAVSIGNLLMLERLHGRAAVHHGLFVSAGRLRRALPGDVETGRLGDDGFLVLVRDVDDVGEIVDIGHELVRRLTRPVALSTSTEPGELESGQARWVAQVGVGIVVADAAHRPSDAIAQARSMSRAAWSFPSCVAWQDDSGHVAEAPQLASA